MTKHLELRNVLQNATLDAEWSDYINQNNTETIQDFTYWEELKHLEDDSRDFHVAIKKFQGMYQAVYIIISYD